MGFSFDIFTTISCYLMEQKLQKNFKIYTFLLKTMICKKLKISKNKTSEMMVSETAVKIKNGQ